MKRKPIFTLLLSVLLVAMVLVGGTMAYLTASDTAVVNEFKLADVQTEIDEPDGGKPEEKAPVVVSNGESEVYVRARAVVVTGEGSSVPVSENDLHIRYNDQSYSGSQNGWKNDQDAYWFKADDGWYYYNQPLAKGERTEPLFDGVDNITQWENPASVKFDIYVYHESVLATETSNGPEAFE